MSVGNSKLDAAVNMGDVFAQPASLAQAAAPQELVAAHAQHVPETAVMAPVPAAPISASAQMLNKLQIRESDKLNKRITVTIEGTINEWAKSGAQWKMDTENLDVLRRASGTGDLSKVLLMGARVCYQDIDAPTDVGFRMTGMKQNCFGRTSKETFTHVAYAGERGRVDEQVHEPDSFITESPELLNSYGSLTKEDIMPTMYDKEDDIYMVKPDSVIGNILQQNAGDLKINWEAQTAPEALAAGKYVQVRGGVVRHIADALDKDVLQRRPYVNMAAFEVEMVRRDGRAFDDVKGWSRVDTSNMARVNAQKALQRKVTLELEIDYIIHDKADE